MPSGPHSNVPAGVWDKVGRNLHLQRNHPIQIIKSHIYQYFARSHKDMQGMPLFRTYDEFPPVVTTTQNFDDLLVPKDHPGRRPTDTFYVDQAHVLRTHTSAHQSELLRRGENAFLVTADCYRRDEIDASHYPVFHQMEGVRLFAPSELASFTAEAVLEDLKRTLEGLVRSLLGDVPLRWVDAYFPFTHPSLELEAFFHGSWLEVLGSGVIHTDVLKLCNRTDRIGWAFGIGIERIAMVLFDVPDIRLFWTQDKRFLEQFSDGNISNRFKPFSKYPPVYKDITFWCPPGFHENDFCSAVRDIAGDLVERVQVIDEFTHGKTGRQSRCYRITYRSMERSLTNTEIDELQQNVRTHVSQELRYELR